MVRKIISMTLFMLLGMVTLSACTQGDASEPEPSQEDLTVQSGNAANDSQSGDADDMLDEDLFVIPEDARIAMLRDVELTMLQLLPVTPGEELAVLHTNHGDITLRFFPTEAPMAVENFITHARNGYYDGLTFHRIIENFMIQGGCPLGTGTGGESIWGGTFGQEFSPHLRHFRGALAMAQSAAPNSIGSQFYIVQNSQIDNQRRAQFESILDSMDASLGRFADGHRLYMRDIHTVEELNYFLEQGGTPHLDWYWNENAHTVFGHVVEGMDIVDAIANVPTAGGGQPVDPVIIERISFVVYGG